MNYTFLKTLENTSYPQLNKIDELIYKWVDDSYDMKDKIHIANELAESKIPNEYREDGDIFGYRCVKLTDSQLKSLTENRYIIMKNGLPLISFSKYISGISDFLPLKPDKKYIVFKKPLISKDICIDVKKWFSLFKSKYKKLFNKEPFVSEIGHMSRMINKECEVICYVNKKLVSIYEKDLLDLLQVSKLINPSKGK